MVPREGFEPPTLSLEVSCSIQLSYRGLVRVARIELASQAWKASILATIRHPRHHRALYHLVSLELMQNGDVSADAIQSVCKIFITTVDGINIA